MKPIKNTIKIPRNRSEYIKMHNNCGLKVGDRVRITHEVPGHYGGWGNSWNHNMTPNVGNVGTILSDNHSYGFRLDCNSGSFYYPFFILKKV